MADSELYFGAFFKVLIISGRLLNDICQFVIFDTQNIVLRLLNQ